MSQETQRDPIRHLLGLAILGGLAATSVWVMMPFLPALIWATMIVIATWPVMLAVEARLWRRRWIATSVMTTTLLLAFVIPLSLAILSIVTHIDVITGWAQSLQAHALDAPPAWVAKLPVVGSRLDASWRDMVQTGDLGSRITSYAGSVGSWFVAQVGDLGSLVVQFLLTVVIAAIFYAKGEVVASSAVRFARAIGGDRGEDSAVLAAKAIRGVALGVVVTAVVQALIGGIGLAIAGVPYVAVLTALMFMLALAQIGAVPVMACATIWVFSRGETGWGIFLVIWTIVVGGLDNVLRPILIRKGVDLPLLLILVGEIGGLIAFGLVGIFVGPAVLAVTYRLLVSWTVASTEHVVLDSDRVRAS
ncbi:MAG: AI-2E family transporter YdiK [Planctomycetota bacterium]|nr:AI-2E family transporter YdiK [Planctomycetota bacterium]